MSDSGAPSPEAAAKAAPHSKLDDWLTPNSAASALFVLKKKVSEAPCWKFFCQVIKVKDDVNVDEVDWPKKWVDRSVDKGQKLAACNQCGDLVSIGCNNAAGKFRQSVAGMGSHLESGKGHGITALDLSKRISKHEIANDPDKERAAKRLKGAGPQTSVFAFAKSGKIKLTPALKKKSQELKTTKFITECMLPFNTVEKESFR